MVTPSDYDALADLFLAGGSLASDAVGAAGGSTTIGASLPFRGITTPPINETIATPSSVKSGPHFVDGIVLGHLPVFAAAWVSQYAKRVSEERGSPVTLVRLHGGRCELDLVGSLNSSHSDTPPTSASAAVAAASQASHTWILRVDEPNETTLATLEGVDRLTILTGADDVAMAATYRTLKFLVSQIRTSDLDEDSIASRLRVMIMGATDEKAASAQEKLRSMMAAFLDAPIEVLVGPQRISPTLMASLFRDATQHDPAEIVSLIRALPKEQAKTVAHAAPVLAAPAPTASRIGPVPSAAIEPPVIHTARISVPQMATPAAPQAQQSTRTPAAHTSATPTPDTSRVEPAVAHSLELVHHVPGLNKLPVQCPYFAEAEIAVDATGSLHLLARADTTHSAADCVARLITTAGWLADHLPLIRLAVPGITLAASADDAALHIFTDQPKDVRHFLNGGVKIHLLASVQVGGAIAWVCRELN